MAWKLVAGIKGLDEPPETLNYYGSESAAIADRNAQQDTFAPDPEDGDIFFWVEEVKPGEPRIKPDMEWEADSPEWRGEDDGK